jgi:hypothetical protein
MGESYEHRRVRNIFIIIACDYGEFVKRNNGEPNTVDWVQDIVVELKDGPVRYKLTSYYSTSNNVDKLKEYATIEKMI